MLDTVTQESAESEGIRDLKHFNDIIKFDISKHVFTILNLWQGFPPLRTVSRSYTQKVHEIKESILTAFFNKPKNLLLALKTLAQEQLISGTEFSVKALFSRLEIIWKLRHSAK